MRSMRWTALVKELLEELLVIMEANTETFMPGFTHLQKAQPVTLAHHVGAYFEMFSRDRSRLTGYPQENELLPTRLRRPGWNYLSVWTESILQSFWILMVQP